MKKKTIVIIMAVLAGLTAGAFVFNRATHSKFAQRKLAELKKSETVASRIADEEESANEARSPLAGAAAAPADSSRLEKDQAVRQEGHADVVTLGPVYKPGKLTDRRLEYQAHLSYQINDLKTARAFFNQWIPRYGFLQNETASGHGNGYLTVNVRIRSANLYAALAELDAIGTLAHEQINVVDHTENAVHQQMLAERERIRLRRRSIAADQNGLASRHWQAAENLLAASEDKELQTRIEEWRVNDKTQWATVTVQLTLPIVTKPAAIEVPVFQNAFVGFLNVLLQSLYVAIYLVPIAGLIWLGWRASLKIIPALRPMPRA